MIEADSVGRPTFLPKQQGDINRRGVAGHGKSSLRAAVGGFNKHLVSSRCHGPYALLRGGITRVPEPALTASSTLPLTFSVAKPIVKYEMSLLICSVLSRNFLCGIA